MGTKISQTKNAESDNNKDKSEIIDIEISSLTNQTKDDSDTSSITFNSNKENKTNFIYYNFLWKGKGKNVLLSGDFSDNWKTRIHMKKNKETGFYEVMLPLERKKYNFKFIVDGEWVCNDLYQTNYDKHFNLNNCIDLTNIYQSDIIKEKGIENENKFVLNKTREKKIYQEEEKNNNSIEDKEEKIKKKFYNSRYPLINELNTSAPSVIEPYNNAFKIDSQSRQKYLKKFSKYLNYKENNINNENSAYKKIMVWPHSNLLHICFNLQNIKNVNMNYYRHCITNRNSHKFLTIVYYKPK